MLEITNKTKGPIQLIVRSKRPTESLARNRPLRHKSAKAFTTLIVPGIGSRKNVQVIEDEAKTEYIDRVESYGLISTRYIPNGR